MSCLDKAFPFKNVFTAFSRPRLVNKQGKKYIMSSRHRDIVDNFENVVPGGWVCSSRAHRSSFFFTAPPSMSSTRTYATSIFRKMSHDVRNIFF